MNSKWSRFPHNKKKVIYIVRVDGYWPELCALTIPNIRRYAAKIGAEVVEITERKYPDFPPTYEKIQVFELGWENEWNILIDADFLIHPMMPDVTRGLAPQVVAINQGYKASAYLDTTDKYFIRDGRNCGVSTEFIVSSNMNHDLWTPLECGWEEARKFTKREFIIDEYCVSRNLARFRLPYVGLFQEEMGNKSKWLVHLGTGSGDQNGILGRAEEVLSRW